MDARDTRSKRLDGWLLDSILKQTRRGPALLGTSGWGKRLCGIRRMHPLLDFRTVFALNNGDVVLALQIKPELGSVAEVERQAKSGIRRD